MTIVILDELGYSFLFHNINVLLFIPDIKEKIKVTCYIEQS